MWYADILRTPVRSLFVQVDQEQFAALNNRASPVVTVDMGKGAMFCVICSRVTVVGTQLCRLVYSAPAMPASLLLKTHCYRC